ncbi:hypothetical protein SAY86_003573 [Trapa natans]|uniref:Protein BYPASS-related n=1 Tax=Trapa natans TaxID=22666 RepID=A0AAN7MHB8_TRANT|nr:hypothetical protein SAY86_003573 [Trapa natans]
MHAAADRHHHGLGSGRSILSLRRDPPVHSLDALPLPPSSPHDHIGIQEADLESFQRQVTERFQDLMSCSGPEEILSVAWTQRLLEVFLSLQEQFHGLVLKVPSPRSTAVDRTLNEFYDRSVKALDVCNAVRDGIEQVRSWGKLLEIVLFALDIKKKNLGEGQFRRAKKALVDLAIGMLDRKDPGAMNSHRNRSFGRSNNNCSNPTTPRDYSSADRFRSLSWSVSRVWSAAKQIQSIGYNLNYPKGNEIVATHGLALAAYTMGVVLLFVMWALVAAIPCQDRGLQAHFAVPRQLGWASPLLTLHDRIVEESKRKERKNACGLLREIYLIEKWSRAVRESVDLASFPLEDEKEREMTERVEELRKVFESLNNGLDPLERQVRVVFHHIVRSRTEASGI